MSVAPPSARRDLVAQLRRVAGAVGEHYDASAAAVGLNARQARLLFVLAVKPVNMLGLTSALGLPKSTMTGLVTRMERAGLLERDAPASDRRSLIATPTERGVATSHEFEADLAGRVKALLAGLDAHEQHELAGLLTDLLGELLRAQSRA